MNSVRIILKFKKPTDSKGYLRISTRIGNKTVLRSLKLPPIEKKYFNVKTERIRASFSKHEEYNNYIEKHISTIKSKGNSMLYINDDKKSFIEFVNKIIDRVVNIGTKQKYTNIKNLLVQFNTEKYNDSDIKFIDINLDFLENFKLWLIKKGNQNNTITYKFKSFHALYNKAIKERIFKYDFDPFHLLNNKLEDQEITILTLKEIKSIINTELKEVYRGGVHKGEIITDEKILNDIRYRRANTLDDVRNYFLFQLFCQGIRVSDILTLRWNDFYITKDEIRIKKRMIKTKSYIDILINYNTLNYLKNYIPVHLLPNDLINKIDSLKTDEEKERKVDEDYKLKLYIDKEINKKYKLKFEESDGIFWVSINDIKNKITNRFNELKQSYGFKEDDNIGVFYNKLDQSLKSKIEFKKDLVEINNILKQDEVLKYLQELLIIAENIYTIQNNTISHINENIQIENYKIYQEIIAYIIDSECKLSFCFPMLRDDDFKDIDEKNNFGNINSYQYLKFIGQRTYYTTLLKYLIKQCGISKNVKPHTSRHSFASFMIENGESLNLYDVMNSLGHKNLSTTQKYIQQFNNKRVDDLNKKMSDFINDRRE